MKPMNPKCPYCGKEFPNYHAREIHLNDSDAYDGMEYSCSDCGAVISVGKHPDRIAELIDLTCERLLHRLGNELKGRG